VVSTRLSMTLAKILAYPAPKSPEKMIGTVVPRSAIITE
jgi:hypothetical protein